MNRWIGSLSCVGAVIAASLTPSSLSGWGGSVENTAPAPYLESNFPMNANQQWFMKETYLIMKPYEDDTDYASKLSTHGALSSKIEMSMKLEKPDFDWYSGVRIGIGRYLANHDKWDISFFTTYYYAQEEDTSTPSRAKETLLTPLWSPTFDGGATKGKAVWRLNFFNWDLSVGRQYNMLRTIVAHPFIGLRAALIYKDYHAKYSDHFASGNIDRTLHDKFKGSDDFWGIGPRAGVDLQFNLRRGWSFLGNLSGALFYGQLNTHEKISVKVLNLGTTKNDRYRLKNTRYTVRANMDAGLGIGWETWLNRHTVRLAPSVLFEASYWWDTNQFFLSKSSGATITSIPILPNLSNQYRQGNLVLMGVSLNLQADF